MEVFLVVGLGNPGEHYARTRHNAGFDVIEILADQLCIRMNKHKSQALVGEGRLDGIKVVLAKPQTYMNLSGESVAPLFQWYKLKPSNLIVIYDDIDLPLGSIRVRASGSAGTHNGMRSIIGILNKSDFPRVRVGVGSPPPAWDLADWVLTHYESEQARKMVYDSFLAAADAVRLIITQDVAHSMQKHNKKVFKEKEPAKNQTVDDRQAKAGEEQ